MRLAHVEDGVVTNVVEVDPSSIPEWAADWPDAGEAGIGWGWDGEVFTAPPERTTTLADLPPVSLAQIVAVLVAEDVVSVADGFGWIAGTLPQQVVDIIETLPEEQRLYASLRAARPTEVNPSDPLISALAQGMGFSDEDVVAWFSRAAVLG